MATRNLFQGCTGSDVRTLQQNLKKLGYYKDGSVDGSFGPITKKAVLQFQKAAKISLTGSSARKRGERLQQPSTSLRRKRR